MDGFEDSSGVDNNAVIEPEGDAEPRPSRRRTVLKSLWYSLGAASAVALVAVVGTQIVQGGGYDEKQRELEKSHKSAAEAEQEEQSTDAGETSKYRLVSNLCELVGDEPYASTLGHEPDSREDVYNPEADPGMSLSLCIMETAATEKSGAFRMYFEARRHSEAEATQEYFDGLSLKLSEPQTCEEVAAQECELGYISSISETDTDRLIAFDSELFVYIVVSPSPRIHEDLDDEERGDLLTEYAQSIFDGLRDA